MDTKRIGNIGEAKVLAALVERKIPVYIPFGDNESADLVAEIKGKLCKIQVKTCSNLKDNGSYIVDLRKNKNPWTAGANDHDSYSKEEVDFFATYNTITKNICLFDLNNFTQSSVTLRIAKTLNNANKNIRYEEDFLLDKII